MKMEDVFTARAVNFQGIPGYMVCQYHKGKKVAEQFVSGETYKGFCKNSGIEPEMINYVVAEDGDPLNSWIR